MKVGVFSVTCHESVQSSLRRCRTTNDRYTFVHPLRESPGHETEQVKYRQRRDVETERKSKNNHYIDNMQVPRE